MYRSEMLKQVRAFLIRKEKEVTKTYPIYKVCTMCKHEKPMADFRLKGPTHHDKYGTDRKSAVCSLCLGKVAKRRNKRAVTYYGVVEYEGGKRICRKCEQEKPLSEFRKGGKRASYSGGIRKISRCRSCESEDRKEYYQRVLKKRREYNKKRREKRKTMKLYHKCKTCGEKKYVTDFYLGSLTVDGSRYPRHSCKACDYGATPELRKKNAERQKRSYWADVEKSRKLKNDWKRKQTEEVSDWFVKHLICSGSILKYKDIDQELIDLKRSEILLNRALKEREQDEKSIIKKRNSVRN